ncbi:MULTISPECIES: hypothetical protein [Streptomyces]|uniref:Secreted protein n=1 Tax=Streptomyces gibsoniae TaxID=3075529 RepID=A0ABU2TT66_9ACTN|nr:hypothetical protein [Streptomyces sp. DSM 41699]MDT0464150.1 hypothetical protein [Streptomyces sp. DSM 41699]
MNQHRKPRTHSAFTQRAVRVGLFAAGAAGIATAVPAQAATGTPQHTAVVTDQTFSRADFHHHTQARDSFTVRQFGTVNAATVRNQANAVGVGCSVDDHCRSVALSFQIVTMAGEHTHLNALNRGDAVNNHCDGCQTLAGAYQFVVSTPRPLNLDQATRQRLDDIHRRLDALTRSTLPATELKQRADALAAEVNTVLNDAVAKAPKGAERPTVTLHRHLDGWPAH